MHGFKPLDIDHNSAHNPDSQRSNTDSRKIGKKRLASRDAIALGGGITLIIPNIKKSNGI